MTKSVGGEINYNHNGSKIKSLLEEGLQRLIKKLRAFHFWLLEQDNTFNQGQKCWHIWAKQTASFRNFKRRLFGRYIALSIFNVEICSVDTVSGCNIEKGRQGGNEKIWDEKLTRLLKQVCFRECLILSELYFTQYEVFRASLLLRLLSST